jgi:hypothetical protein
VNEIDLVDFVWVFSGAEARFPSGVFRTKDAAVHWIGKHSLTGVLTAYPLDEGVYDWALRNHKFTPKSEKHLSPDFIGKFTAGAQPHFHYSNGQDCYAPSASDEKTPPRQDAT